MASILTILAYFNFTPTESKRVLDKKEDKHISSANTNGNAMPKEKKKILKSSDQGDKTFEKRKNSNSTVPPEPI